MTDDDALLGRDFDLLMTRAGIDVPVGDREGAIRAYIELVRAAAMVRRPRAAASPPAYVFSLEAMLRGIGDASS